MYFRPPKIIPRLFPSLIWCFETQEKTVYLTFDDGPNPEVTPWVLEQLAKYNAKATFFCLGKNVEQYPETFQRIKDVGHAVGNHSYSHLKGWEMRTGRYVEDVDLADSFIHSNLFRPPYGRIKPSQIRRLEERYNLIMWGIISSDYSSLTSPRKCVKNVIGHVHPGAIIVFHDSKKAFGNLRYALPKVLEFLAQNGYRCEAIQL